MRIPRLGWRLLDALSTEEIIIGGLRPGMFDTADGSLNEGQLGMAAMMGGYAGAYSGGLSGPAYGYDQEYGDPQYDAYGDNGYAPNNGRQPQPSLRLDGHSAEMSEMLGQYAKLISDWMAFTEEKWRAVSDSQLGWKPLRGRWNGWEEIYRYSFAVEQEENGDTTLRRFGNSHSKGSAASAVACFLHDVDGLRQGLGVLAGGEEPAEAQPNGRPRPPHPATPSCNKTTICPKPVLVDAHRSTTVLRSDTPSRPV